MTILKKCFNIIVLFIFTGFYAQVHDKSWRSITENKDENWFATNEAIEIAENVLLYQREIGGWPKNIQIQNQLSIEEKQKLLALKSHPIECTTDNGATCQEMLYLSKMYKKNQDERYKTAFLKGLDYLLEAQYDNGGWPQFYPLMKGYYSHITYNDDSMVNILGLFREIKNHSNFYSINPSPEVVKKIELAFEKGIDCILKTQYKQNGELTSWCAQYNEVTLLPANARAYELISLSGKESVKIVLLLMSIENPNKDIIAAVESAVRWFEKTKITNIKLETVLTEDGKKNRVVVETKDAELLWARFMDIDTNAPFFCDRDGIKKATLAEIGSERRNGYAWYSDDAKTILKRYPIWKKQITNH
jgi:pectinesterase